VALSIACRNEVRESPPPQAPVEFELNELSVAQLQEAMTAGRFTSRRLVELYLQRIAQIDSAGPRLRAVIETNPDALAIADGLDSERKAKGPRGPMHGIPVLIKDNIDTGDKMLTSAGSLALTGGPAPRDAFVVERLRAAGAVIIGKTNLSEWANIRSPRSTSGWSARGGLTKNPFELRHGCRDRREPRRGGCGHRDRWLGRVPLVDQRSRRHQADHRSREPLGDRSHRPLAGHGRSDGAHGHRRRRAAECDDGQGST
jgi:amidase